ncbi:hypothetical protein DC20_10765 [Rufibacter tibetensis]|uniref:Uncharacterized protein n=1 Tax=Rufibacter tibetensis TaxID=512763 RepID=A0A0P0CS97_9BACT|nr:hypothetical protein DC20_10765 [Rufibacter tibetensis]
MEYGLKFIPDENAVFSEYEPFLKNYDNKGAFFNIRTCMVSSVYSIFVTFFYTIEIFESTGMGLPLVSEFESLLVYLKFYKKNATLESCVMLADFTSNCFSSICITGNSPIWNFLKKKNKGDLSSH